MGSVNDDIIALLSIYYFWCDLSVCWELQSDRWSDCIIIDLIITKWSLLFTGPEVFLLYGKHQWWHYYPVEYSLLPIWLYQFSWGLQLDHWSGCIIIDWIITKWSLLFTVPQVFLFVQDEQRKDTLKKNLLLLVLHYLNEEGYVLNTCICNLWMLL